MNTDDPHLKCHLMSQVILHICPHHYVVVLNLRCRRSCHNANEKFCAIILLVEFGVLLRLELLGVRDDQFSRNTLSIIICLCSSSKVLICAFELLSPTGFPVLARTFSAWVCFRKLAVSTNHVKCDTRFS